MRRLKLRSWVKYTLVGIAIIVFFIVSNAETNKAVDQCVKAGHTQTYCENGLR